MFKEKILLILSFMLIINSSASAQCGPFNSNAICDQLLTELERQNCWFDETIRHVYNFDLTEKEKFRDVNYGKSSYSIPYANAPWGGNYFKSENNGIAYRWNSQKKIKAVIDTSEARFSAELKPFVNNLSPIEKYDLYMGYFDFKATKKEILGRGKLRQNPMPSDGYCNGVRAAGVLTTEPSVPITVESKGDTSLKITFYPADIKALLGANYFFVEKYGQAGCPFSSNQEWDIDPKIFDISFRYILGEKNRCFFIETDTSQRKMNQTIIGYDRKIISRTNIDGKNIVNIAMTVYTLGEFSIEQSNTPTKNLISNFRKKLVNSKNFRTHHYSYSLIVDNNNNIVSGQWKAMRPDIIWFAGGTGTDNIQYGLMSNTYLTGKMIEEIQHSRIHQ